MLNKKSDKAESSSDKDLLGDTKSEPNEIETNMGKKKYHQIAISGKSGCGNSTVSRLVAEKLKIDVINYTFRNMAEDEGLSFLELCRLAEETDAYDIKLDKKQVELASQKNCVLGSRLAVWMLNKADIKVYLEASLETRAERINSREGGSFEEKLQETLERDRRDTQRYKRIYGIDNNDYHFVDLIINTDISNQFETAEKIVEAYYALQVR